MSSSQAKAIILLDPVSRNKMRTNLADLIIYGIHVVTSLGEITKEMLTDTKEVFLLEDSISQEGLYSDIQLYSRELNLKFNYLSRDEAFISVMSSVATCYRIDSFNLDYDKISAILYGDTIAIGEIKLTSSKPDTLKYANDLLNDTRTEGNIRRVAESYVSLYSIVEKVSQQLDDMKSDRAKDKSVINRLSEENKHYSSLYQELLGNIINLNSTLSQYEVILSKDVYEKIQVNRYPNRPRIIYLKEYQELVHLDSLVTTLFETFRLNGKESVKVLRLFDSSGSRKILTLPSYYTKIENNFKKRDVISNDFVAKVGGYREVFDLLLTNHNNLDLLIVVDCKDHTGTVLTEMAVEFGMCRNPNNLSIFGLDPDLTITSTGNNEMRWDHYDNYHSLDDNDRFLFLSSRPVIQNIYERDRLFNRR